MKKRAVLILAAMAFAQSVACLCLPLAHGVVLYDGSLGAGDQEPNDQGWLYLTDPIVGASATHSASGGVATLDTTAEMRDDAGYFSTGHLSMPTLDRFGDGYTIRFDANIVSETHISSDRAGFSVIALSSDVNGIEIGFWENEIWTQNGPPQLFTHGEGVAFDTTAGLVRYDLAIQGSSYELYADGQNILQGSLRDYSSHSHPAYSTPSLLFFGDDTGSAAGVSQLAYVEVLDYAVPEPTTLFLVSLGGLPLLRKRGR